MQRRESRGAIMRATHRLAIDGHDLARQHLTNRGHPGPKALLERPRRQQREDPPEGVVGGDAVGQLQELSKPRLLGAPERRDTHPVVRAADHRRDRDHHHVDQLVAALARVARVLKGRKMARQGALQVLGRQLSYSTRQYLPADYESIFTPRLEEYHRILMRLP